MDVGALPHCFILDISGHQFLHHFLHEGHWANGTISVSLSVVTFPGVGINIILACLQSVGMYLLARQSLICTYF